MCDLLEALCAVFGTRRGVITWQNLKVHQKYKLFREGVFNNPGYYCSIQFNFRKDLSQKY